MSEEIIKIYTDGACSGNPGPGGFGWVLLFRDHKIEHSEGETLTTNNKMELSAVISALQYYDENRKKDKLFPIHIYTDSNLIVQAINQNWLKAWSANGWKKADKKPVKNQELWEDLLFYLRKYQIKFIWLKGHTGDEFNERCDTLARDAAGGDKGIYHKLFKLIKGNDKEISEEYLKETVPQVPELIKNPENDVLNFLFEYHPRKKEIRIEQISVGDKEKRKQIKHEIVINKSNFEEFKEKFEKLIKNFDK